MNTQLKLLTPSELLEKAFADDPTSGGLTSNSTMQEFCNKINDKNKKFGDVIRSLFAVELFSWITLDQIFSALYTLITITIIILQQSQKNSTLYSNKYFNLNLSISIFQIILGIISLAFASYQTFLYLNGNTFVLAERTFDIFIKLMSAVLLFGTAITTLKTDTAVKKQRPTVAQTEKRKSKFF